jgi:DNA-directed RNA polymerase specialized sigma24 family protein
MPNSGNGIAAYHGILRFTRSMHMETINPADGLDAARQQLTEIWADPQIRGFARQYARDPQVADDALQSAYLAMAKLRHLDQIGNLRAYFCRVLVRAVHHERAQLGALPVDDITLAADGHEGANSHGTATAGFEDAACTSMQAESWHKRLTSAREELAARVPARSGEPSRYQRVIYAAAEQILRDGISGEPSEADTNDAFRAAYPAYFDEPGAPPNTRHQRLRRARVDVRELLRTVTG